MKTAQKQRSDGAIGWLMFGIVGGVDPVGSQIDLGLIHAEQLTELQSFFRGSCKTQIAISNQTTFRLLNEGQILCRVRPAPDTGNQRGLDVVAVIDPRFIVEPSQ
ncbi:MAG: hypothetical protein ABSG53_23690 [Thermoguttaceae bacterium]